MFNNINKCKISYVITFPTLETAEKLESSLLYPT